MTKPLVIWSSVLICDLTSQVDGAWLDSADVAQLRTLLIHRPIVH